MPRIIRSHFLPCCLFVTALTLPSSALAKDDGAELGCRYGARLILDEPGGGADSSVSPDGKWIAFSSRRSGNMDIWIVSTETGETRQITNHPATDNEPRWHPDGTHLTFVTMRDRSQDVYIVDLETGEETPIAIEKNNEDYPSFSKDGTEICYTGGPRGFREVKVYNFETGEHRTLTKGFGYVGSTNFSREGDRIVFHAYYDNSYVSGRADVYTIASKGGEPTNITKVPDIWDYKPNWSFDGNWITFSSKRDTPNFNIFVMRPDGSDLEQVTHFDGVVTRTRSGKVSMANRNPTDLRWSNWTRDGRIGFHRINPQYGQLKAYDVATGTTEDLFRSDFAIKDVSLSPNGETLLFENDAQVLTMNPDQDSPKTLGRGSAPRWSPDGDTVAFLRSRGTKIASIPAAGGEITTVDVQPTEWPSPQTVAFSPDSRSMATLTEEDGKQTIALIRGDQVKTIATGKSLTAPVWSADGKHLYFSENEPASVSYYLTEKPLREMQP